jgi:hypothetical protein
MRYILRECASVSVECRHAPCHIQCRTAAIHRVQSAQQLRRDVVIADARQPMKMGAKHPGNVIPTRAKTEGRMKNNERKNGTKGKKKRNKMTQRKERARKEPCTRLQDNASTSLTPSNVSRHSCLSGCCPHKEGAKKKSIIPPQTRAHERRPDRLCDVLRHPPAFTTRGAPSVFLVRRSYSIPVRLWV